MKNTARYILKSLLFLILLLNGIDSSAQVGKPVTVIVSLTPPYTPFLNEYASFETNKLQVTLIANDSHMQNYPVKLQMFIQRYGTGVVMQTGEYAAIPPVYLTAGTSEILDGVSLSQYFSAQNNVFAGFDRSQYIQTGRIPDGQYRIGFRVTDAKRSDVILSETVYSQPGWFILNDPPQLNLPLNEAAVEVQNIQNVKLEWFPRHLGSLNSAFAVNYQVELYALRVPGTNPASVVASLPPDYIGETGQNLFFLKQSDYLLEPGLEYAWRVKAYADNGLTLFQNNGYSEVRTFVYGSLCPEVENTEADILGTDEVEFSWDTDPKQTTWEIRLRKENSEDDWYTQETNTIPLNIKNILSEGTAYEYQVKALCNLNESDYSPLKTFSTEVFELPENFECGAEDTVEITNFIPKLSIFIGEIIYNGEFPVKITEISGSNGIFSGKGRMRIPMLANVQVNMQFENIKVNELNQVYEGEMVSVYNPDSPFFIDDITDYFAEGDQVGNIITGQDSAAITLDYPIDNNTNIIINTDGTITIGGTTTETVDDLASGTTIEDSEGDIYAVDENGNITEIGTSGDEVSPEDYNNTASLYNQLDSTITVVFENNGTWAFDSRNPDYAGSPFDNEYQKLGDYYVPWKFIPLGKSDKIKALVTKGNIEDPDKVKFLTPTGTEFFAEYNDGYYELESTGGKTGDGVEIYAIYMPDDSTKRSLGKLRIASYPKKEMKVKCIPVGDFSIDNKISEELLNEIYAPYYINWTVTIDEAFTDTSWNTGDPGLQATGSGFWSQYTDEMQALKDVYTEQRGTDEESLYLFFFKNGNSDEDQLSGDMPLKSRFGFIFNAAESSDKITKTAAHELAHGAFQLKHTFSSKYNIDQYSTQNLMDYNGGIELVKYQWDVIHDPQNKLFNWMQGEEEGNYNPWEHVSVNMQEFTISQIPGSKNEDILSFISPAGIVYSLTGSFKDFSFYKGFLTGFTSPDNKRYLACYNNDFKFAGFRSNKDYSDSTFIESWSKALNYNDLNVYYGLTSTDENSCNNEKYELFLATYNGTTISTDSKGFTNEKDSFLLINKSVTDIGILSENISSEIITDIFLCLKTRSLKFLYKYIEYNFEDKDISFLNDLFTNLNSFKGLYINGIESGFEYNPSKDKTFHLKIDDYNALVQFKDDVFNYIENNDVSGKNIRIVLTDESDKDIFPEYIAELIPYYNSIKNCILEGSDSNVPQGYFLPLCIWENTQVSPLYYYGITDPAFTCGFSDGIIGTVYDIYNMALNIADLEDAYSSALIACKNGDISEISNEYKLIAEKTFKIEKNLSVIITSPLFPELDDNFKQYLNDLKSALDNIENGIPLPREDIKKITDILKKAKEYFSDDYNTWSDYVDDTYKMFGNLGYTPQNCDKAEQTRAEINKLLDFAVELTNPEDASKRNMFFDDITEALSNKLQELNGTDNLARYKQGKLVGQIASQILLAAVTSGGGNIEEGLNIIASSIKSLPKKFIAFVKAGYGEIANIKITQNFIKYGEKVLIKFKQLEQAEELLVLAPLPENAVAENVNIIKSNFFEDSEFILPDGTKPVGDCDLVEYNGERYIKIKSYTDPDFITALKLKYTGQSEIIGWIDEITNPELLSKLDKLPTAAYTNLENDITSASANALKEAFNSEPEVVEAWEILLRNDRTGGNIPANGLTRNTDALEALSNIRKNPKLAETGITDDVLGQINGWGSGTDINASYADVINDLDNMITNFGTKNITVSNLNKITDVLTGGTNSQIKGMHWVVQDLATDITTFNGKTITVDFSIDNARGTTSFIDVYCADCDIPKLKIEYKHGPTSIKSKTIKEQFIERDLFNATSLEEIQWRMKDTEFTPDKLKNWMKENKNYIDELIQRSETSQKFKDWFNLESFENNVTDSKIDDFVNSNYNSIFK